MSKHKVECPYMSDDGIPIHLLPEAERNSYVMGFDVDDATQIIMHANRLASRIKAHMTERADMRKKSRELLKVPSTFTPEQRQDRMDELEALRVKYEGTEADINKLKSTVYTQNDEGKLVIPRVGK